MAAWGPPYHAALSISARGLIDVPLPDPIRDYLMVLSDEGIEAARRLAIEDGRPLPSEGSGTIPVPRPSRGAGPCPHQPPPPSDAGPGPQSRPQPDDPWYIRDDQLHSALNGLGLETYEGRLAAAGITTLAELSSAAELGLMDLPVSDDVRDVLLVLADSGLEVALRPLSDAMNNCPPESKYESKGDIQYQ